SFTLQHVNHDKVCNGKGGFFSVFVCLFVCDFRWDRKLAGYTSLWALPISGSGIVEGLYPQLRSAWASFCGSLGPWDYSGFHYNFKGLVTREYVLPWAVACLIAKQHIMKNTLKMYLGAIAQDRTTP
uniref:Uncharacterized protein n=1 Tax=Scleropages formosus TaxID=113540 RepID=A0A8C9TS47_SCLFO